MTKKSREINVIKDNIPKEEQIAQLVLKPSINAASTIELFQRRIFGDLDVTSLSKVLNAQTKALHRGDLSGAESLLISQAHTLDALFNALCARSAANMGEYLSTMETYMRLALKAQNQCQATLRTLGELKSPKSVAFVKQANIAENQQINNGQPKDVDKSRARKSKKQQNELLEEKDGEWLDGGTKATTSSTDTALETVGAVNRAKE